jgi:hypothetical protein
VAAKSETWSADWGLTEAISIDRPNVLVFGSGERGGPRTGIYAEGGCDTSMVFTLKSFIEPVLRGTCCIVRRGNLTASRSDLLLQTLERLPTRLVEEVNEKLELRRYFETDLFDADILVPTGAGRVRFPKHVVLLSIGADLYRVLYRHNDQPLLVDPGGAWIGRPMHRMLGRPDVARWFREHFHSIGRLTVEEFANNYTRLIKTIKSQTKAKVVVFNFLAPDPEERVHSYQFLKDPMPVRKREFNLALTELSRKLDFAIVDLDRVFQREGILGVGDVAHPHPRYFPAIGQEIFRVLQELEVF